MTRLFALENRIDPGSLDVLLQLHPAWIAAQEGSQNVHGLTTGVNNRPPTNQNSTYPNPEWCSMPLDKGCGIERFKGVKHHNSPPRETNDPVTNQVPDKGAGVEVGWDSAGRWRGESDVDEQSHHPCRQEP